MAKDQEVERIAKKLDKMVNKNNTVSVSAREVQHQEAGSAGLRAGQLHFHLWGIFLGGKCCLVVFGFVVSACRMAMKIPSIFMKAVIWLSHASRAPLSICMAA